MNSSGIAGPSDNPAKLSDSEFPATSVQNKTKIRPVGPTVLLKRTEAVKPLSKDYERNWNGLSQETTEAPFLDDLITRLSDLHI